RPNMTLFQNLRHAVSVPKRSAPTLPSSPPPNPTLRPNLLPECVHLTPNRSFPTPRASWSPSLPRMSSLTLSTMVPPRRASLRALTPCPPLPLLLPFVPSSLSVFPSRPSYISFSQFLEKPLHASHSLYPFLHPINKRFSICRKTVAARS